MSKKAAAPAAPAASLSEALAALEPAARFARAFQDVHVAIEAGASIEQAVREADKAIIARRATLAEVGVEIEKAQAKADQARAEADAILKAAGQEADATRAHARAQGDEIVKAARAAKGKADVAASAAQARADEIERNLAAKVAELADVEAKIEKARQQVQKLLG